MKKLKLTIKMLTCIILITLFLLPVLPVTTATTENEIQGIWIGYEVDGEPGEWRCVITEETWSLTGPDEKSSGKYTINNGEADFYYDFNDDLLSLVIYKREENNMTISVGCPLGCSRPTSFTNPDGINYRVYQVEYKEPINYNKYKPKKPIINGPKNCEINKNYTYTAVSYNTENTTLQYIFNWGDKNSDEIDKIENNQTINITHKWKSAGLYNLKVHTKNKQNLESDKAEMIILVDVNVEYIKDEIKGYLIDYNKTNNYTKFHNNETGIESIVEKQKTDYYLIDIENNGEWDYIYNKEIGLETYNNEEEKHDDTPGFELINLILIIITILSILILKKQK